MGTCRFIEMKVIRLANRVRCKPTSQPPLANYLSLNGFQNRLYKDRRLGGFSRWSSWMHSSWPTQPSPEARQNPVHNASMDSRMPMWNSAKVFFPILKFSGDRFDVVCSISFPVITRALELSMSFEVYDAV